MESIGKILIVTGIFIVMAGVLMLFWDKIPLSGKLPGALVVEKDNIRVYFPLATSLIISVVLTLVINLILLFFK
jgi:hypothetical protein